MSHTAYQPQTIGEFNQALQSLNFAPVSKEQLDAVLTREPKQRLVKAINQAISDNRAFQYLKGLFVYCGSDNDTAPFTEEPSSPQPGQDNSVSSEPETTEGKDFRKKHVYGGSAALFFESDENRKGDYTVRIEGAPSIGTKQFDWNNKICIQLTQHELLIVTAIFYGMLSKCEYGNHGPDKTKGFSIEDQGDKLFVKVYTKGKKACAVPMTPEDAFFVAQICLGQIKKNAPWLSGSEILSTLQRVVAARKTARSS